VVAVAESEAGGAREADHLRRRRLRRGHRRLGQRDGVPLLVRHGRAPRLPVRVGVVWGACRCRGRGRVVAELGLWPLGPRPYSWPN
jgi:hypothetical protein